MRLIKYLWYNAVMTATAWLPDVRPVLQLRGFLARPAFKKCGSNFQIAGGVMINFPNCLEIGRDVYFGPGSWIHAPGGIVVEDEVQLGPYVVLITGDHTLKDGSYRYGPGKPWPDTPLSRLLGRSPRNCGQGRHGRARGPGCCQRGSGQGHPRLRHRWRNPGPCYQRERRPESQPGRNTVSAAKGSSL